MIKFLLISLLFIWNVHSFKACLGHGVWCATTVSQSPLKITAPPQSSANLVCCNANEFCTQQPGTNWYCL